MQMLGDGIQLPNKIQQNPKDQLEAVTARQFPLISP